MNKKIVVAITGASGVIYGLRLIEELKKSGYIVYLIVSKAGIVTLQHEVETAKIKNVLSKVDDILENDDIGCFLASGSFKFDAMVIIPCSIHTVGMIHSNLAGTLIGRCALIAQKERRRLIVVPREMPFSTQTLKQLYELSSFGIDICIPSPGFYNKPFTLDDLVNSVVGKVLNLLDVPNNLVMEWKGLPLYGK